MRKILLTLLCTAIIENAGSLNNVHASSSSAANQGVNLPSDAQIRNVFAPHLLESIRIILQYVTADSEPAFRQLRAYILSQINNPFSFVPSPELDRLINNPEYLGEIIREIQEPIIDGLRNQVIRAVSRYPLNGTNADLLELRAYFRARRASPPAPENPIHEARISTIAGCEELIRLANAERAAASTPPPPPAAEPENTEQARREAADRLRQEQERQQAEQARREAADRLRQERERQQAEQARREAADRLRQEQERQQARREAADRLRQEQERQQARQAEQARREAADRLRQEQERQQARQAEQARREAADRLRQEQARQQEYQWARQPAAETHAARVERARVWLRTNHPTRANNNIASGDDIDLLLQKANELGFR